MWIVTWVRCFVRLLRCSNSRNWKLCCVYRKGLLTTINIQKGVWLRNVKWQATSEETRQANQLRERLESKWWQFCNLIGSAEGKCNKINWRAAVVDQVSMKQAHLIKLRIQLDQVKREHQNDLIDAINMKPLTFPVWYLICFLALGAL